jgi:hypothetical protein
MIQDTQRQLRTARERLSASREALAASHGAGRSGEIAAAEASQRERRPEPHGPEQRPRGDEHVPDNAPAWLRRQLGRLPVWARPAAAGAFGLAVITGVRAVAVLPRAASEPRMLLEAGAAMLVVATAGAAGGLAFSLIRPRLETLGGVGDVFTGMVCVAAYMLAIFAVAPMAFGARAVGGGIIEAVAAAVFCIFLFGPVVGLTWFYAARKRRMK